MISQDAKQLEADGLIKTINGFISEIQHEILTSNTVADRILHPYYYSHFSVPESLKDFKARIVVYRQISSELINQSKSLPLSLDTPTIFRSLEAGTFAHTFIGSLVVASCGLGECSECSSTLALKLINSGYGNLAVVGLEFGNAQEGQEHFHQFIVANLPNQPSLPKSSQVTYLDFLRSLPPTAIVADAFLGLAFYPHRIPEKFSNYIAAYGDRANVISCFHLKNWSPNSTILVSYLAAVDAISISLKRLLLEKGDNQFYNFAEKIPIADTQLTLLLKSKTNLSFFSVRDSNYKVDAIVKIDSSHEEKIVKSLQYSLCGQGLFFNLPYGQSMFVLEGINLTDGGLLAKQIYDVCRGK